MQMQGLLMDGCDALNAPRTLGAHVRVATPQRADGRERRRAEDMWGWSGDSEWRGGSARVATGANGRPSCHNVPKNGCIACGAFCRACRQQYEKEDGDEILVKLKAIVLMSVMSCMAERTCAVRRRRRRTWCGSDGFFRVAVYREGVIGRGGDVFGARASTPAYNAQVG